MTIRFHRPPGTDAELAYLDIAGSGAGGGSPRVYLGGLGSAATTAFVPVLAHPALADGRRAVVVDWVGSGWSDHDDAWSHTIEDHASTVAALLDHLGVTAATVVGHSLGGSVAICMASARPDIVGHLVVCEPNLDPGAGAFSAEIAAASEAEFADTGHRSTVAALRAAAADPNAAELARTVARWSAVGLHRTAVSLLAGRTPTFRDQLNRLPMHRTFVAGERSTAELDPPGPGCPVLVVDGAGHLMTSDNPDGFGKLLAGL